MKELSQVHWSQIAGGVLTLLGLLLLFLLRDPLWKFIVVIFQLFFIFVGIVMVIVGIALLVGGRWMRRWRWGTRPTGT